MAESPFIFRTLAVRPTSILSRDAETKNARKAKLTEKNGKYTFTMPTGKVTVKGIFVEKAPEQLFADVPMDAYYYEAVKWAAGKSITGGIGNDLFASNQPRTRTQIVTLLFCAPPTWRMGGGTSPPILWSIE